LAWATNEIDAKSDFVLESQDGVDYIRTGAWIKAPEQMLHKILVAKNSDSKQKPWKPTDLKGHY